MLQMQVPNEYVRPKSAKYGLAVSLRDLPANRLTIQPNWPSNAKSDIPDPIIVNKCENRNFREKIPTLKNGRGHPECQQCTLIYNTLMVQTTYIYYFCYLKRAMSYVTHK